MMDMMELTTENIPMNNAWKSGGEAYTILDSIFFESLCMYVLSVMKSLLYIFYYVGWIHKFIVRYLAY